MRICGCHANNYNNTYFCELSQMNLENAFIDLNNFTMDLAYEMEVRTIVKEDVTVRDVNKGDNKKAKTFIDRVKKVVGNLLKYIRNIIAFFVNKVDDLMNNNEEWISKNAYKIDGISSEFWSQCDITLYPYDFKNQYGGNNVFTEDVYAQAIEPNTNTQVAKQITAGFNSKDEFYKTVAPKIYKINPEDFTAACKTYYRGGKNLIGATGNDAEKICIHGLKYANNYKALSNKIKSDLNKYRGIVEKFQRDSEQRSKQEGSVESALFPSLEFYSVLEDRYIRYDEIEISNEAITLNPVKALKDRTQREYDKQVGSSQSNGTVTMDEKKNGEDNTENTPSQPSQTSQASQIFTRMLEYYRAVLTVQTARMTIAEEAYNAYMRTIKTVVRTAESRKEISLKTAQNKQKGLIKRGGEKIVKGVKKLTGTSSSTKD